MRIRPPSSDRCSSERDDARLPLQPVVTGGLVLVHARCELVGRPFRVFALCVGRIGDRSCCAGGCARRRWWSAARSRCRRRSARFEPATRFLGDVDVLKLADADAAVGAPTRTNRPSPIQAASATTPPLVVCRLIALRSDRRRDRSTTPPFVDRASTPPVRFSPLTPPLVVCARTLPVSAGQRSPGRWYWSR